MSVIRAAQEAAAERLLSVPAVASKVVETRDGPAVFAPGQPFDDLYPRLVLRTPQRVPRRSTCGTSADLFVTIDAWAQGPDCTLVAGALGDAAGEALDMPLEIAGWRVSSHELLGVRAVGDPSPGIEHVVVELRYSVQRTA